MYGYNSFSDPYEIEVLSIVIDDIFCCVCVNNEEKIFFDVDKIIFNYRLVIEVNNRKYITKIKQDQLDLFVAQYKAAVRTLHGLRGQVSVVDHTNRG
jgi:hypothetical protein